MMRHDTCPMFTTLDVCYVRQDAPRIVSCRVFVVVLSLFVVVGVVAVVTLAHRHDTVRGLCFVLAAIQPAPV